LSGDEEKAKAGEAKEVFLKSLKWKKHDTISKNEK
jgi:hypothetical protein